MSLADTIARAEEEAGPHPSLDAFLTVHHALGATTGSDAARAYHEGAAVTLYSDEGTPYQIEFSSLLDELLTLAAMDVHRRLTQP